MQGLGRLCDTFSARHSINLSFCLYVKYLLIASSCLPQHHQCACVQEPVWQQLLNMCEEGWSAERWKSMLTEQQQDNQALKDTIAELQRHNEELQRHNKELLLRLDQLEQQQQQPSRNT